MIQKIIYKNIDTLFFVNFEKRNLRNGVIELFQNTKHSNSTISKFPKHVSQVFIITNYAQLLFRFILYKNGALTMCSKCSQFGGWLPETPILPNFKIRGLFYLDIMSTFQDGMIKVFMENDYTCWMDYQLNVKDNFEPALYFTPPTPVKDNKILFLKNGMGFLEYFPNLNKVTHFFYTKSKFGYFTSCFRDMKVQKNVMEEIWKEYMKN